MLPYSCCVWRLCVSVGHAPEWLQQWFHGGLTTRSDCFLLLTLIDGLYSSRDLFRLYPVGIVSLPCIWCL